MLAKAFGLCLTHRGFITLSRRCSKRVIKCHTYHVRGRLRNTNWLIHKKRCIFSFFCSLDFLFWKIKSSIKSENKKKHGLLYSIRSNKIDFSAIVFASLLGVQVLQQHHYMLCTTCMPTNTRKHKQRPGLNSRSAHARKAESSRRTSLQSITCFALAACSKWVCQPIINMEQK